VELMSMEEWLESPLYTSVLGMHEVRHGVYLSRHTVSQYVKRIYRKLGVDSRVALTRLLLGRRESDQDL
jgi:Bacterial regulatory proteins, luxR family